MLCVAEMKKKWIQAVWRGRESWELGTVRVDKWWIRLEYIGLGYEILKGKK